MRRLHVDEIETLPVLGGSLAWKPVRRALGIDAFGINAYQAEHEGELVVEEHEDAHQELYLVLRGSARFRSGAKEFTGPAGTFVLFDAGEHRVAHAAEPGTTVVAIGGPPGRFEVSGWEHSFRAKALVDLGRLDEAERALEEGFASHPDRPDLLYARACLEAARGEREAARATLLQAIDAHPDVREWAAEERLLAGLL